MLSDMIGSTLCKILLTNFFNEVQNLGDVLNERLQSQAETRLRKLQQGHTDLIGAAVSIEQPAKAETAFLYRARVVVYIRPENLAATAQEDDPLAALKRALSQVELLLEPGNSWVVPKGANHTYKILEPFTAVEATHPPAHVKQRDTP